MDIDAWIARVSRPADLDASALNSGPMLWPAGFRAAQADEVRYLLARSARWHARLAVEKSGSSDLDDLLQVAASAGTALELLAKAYLATISPSLLSGDHRDVHTNVMLAGRSGSKDRPATTMKSIGVLEALRAVEQLHHVPRGKYPPPPISARNAALHMALVDGNEAADAVTYMARYVEALLPALELDRTAFWGEHTAVAVTSLLSEHADEIVREVEVRRAAAWASYMERTKELDPAAKAVVVQALVGQRPRYAERERKEYCPVCRNDGWLSMIIREGPIEADYDKEGFVEGAWVSRTGYPVRFRCFVCGFEIDEEELELDDFEELQGPFDLEPVSASYYYSDYYDPMKATETDRP